MSPEPSLSTIYRVLVRHGLVAARKRKRRRQDYKPWQREAPMQLWQPAPVRAARRWRGAQGGSGIDSGGLS